MRGGAFRTLAAIDDSILANRTDLHVWRLLVALGVVGGLVATAVLIARRRRNVVAEGGDGAGDPGRRAFAPLEVGALVLIAVVAVVLLLARGRGLYFPDTKFLLYFNPERGFDLNRLLWDPNRNFGNFAATQQGPIYAITGTMQWVGLAPWLIQRMFIGLMLTVGGVGTAMVARWIRPGRPIVMAVAGLWFVLAPYTIAFVRPINLYTYVAICPWLILGVVRGMESEHKWRWAALLALAVGIPGTMNVPGLVWTCVPLVPAAVAMIWTGRARIRDLMTLALRTLALLIPMLAPSLYRIVVHSGVLSANLAATETVESISMTSSWPESLRGLGGWLAYYAPGGSPSIAGSTALVTNAVVILVTFVPVVAAFLVVALRRNVSTVVIGTTLVISGAAMVGAFPYADPSPLGAVVKWSFESVPSLLGLRNTFKAGGGVLLAIALLLGIGADALREWSRRPGPESLRAVRRGTVLVAVLALGATFAVGAAPYLRGRFVLDRPTTAEIPSYWGEAIDWLDSQPDSTATLIAPFSYSALYTWGNGNGGDIFPSLMSRPYLLGEPIIAGPADATNMVQSIGQRITDGTYEAGELGPVARRLGIGWVMIRNDLDWRAAIAPRPAALQSLRSDPDLRLVATFGDPPGGASAALGSDDAIEMSLPPVEIYRVGSVDGSASLLTRRPSMLVSGDGSAWFGMANDGELDSGDPIQYTGRLDASAMSDAVSEGASVVVTDTNRRTNAKIGSRDRSVKSLDDESPTSDLFGSPDTQTVADLGDASEIYEVVPRVTAPSPSHRPAVAFDRSSTTAWIAGTGAGSGAETIGVVLRESKVFTSLTVQSLIADVADPSLANPVTGAVLRLGSDPTPIPIRFDGGVGRVEIAPRSVDGFSIEITSVAGTSGVPFGFSSVDVPGIDLRESLRLPLDLVHAADSDPRLKSGLALAALEYRFDRLRTRDEPLIETILRRRIVTPVDRTYTISGRFAAGAQLSDAFIASLSPGSIVARSADSGSEVRSSRAFNVVDGDTATWWSPRLRGGGLELTFSKRTVSSVVISLDESTAAQVPPKVSVTINGVTRSKNLDWDLSCMGVATFCPRDVVFDFPATTTDAITIDIAPNANPIAPPVRILEVELDGRPNVAPTAPLPSTCRDDLVSVDGRAVPVRLVGSLADVWRGSAISVLGCGSVSLSAGGHLIEGTTIAPMDSLRLRSDASVPRATVVAGGGDAREYLTLDTGSGVGGTTSIGPSAEDRILLSGQGLGAAWAARAAGESLGAPVELDIQSAWIVPASSVGGELVTTYPPQRALSITLFVSLAGFLVAILLLVLAGSDVVSEGSTFRRRRMRGESIAVIVIGVVAAFGVGGLSGLAIIAAALIARRWFDRVGPLFGVAAAAAMVAAAVFTVPPVGPEIVQITPWFATLRPDAATAGRFAVLFLVASLMSAALDLIGTSDRTSGVDSREWTNFTFDDPAED